MPASCTEAAFQACPLRVVCRCLRVTEEEVVDALATLPLRSVRDICRHTGAGAGCTACHAELEQLLETHAYLPESEIVCAE